MAQNSRQSQCNITRRYWRNRVQSWVGTPGNIWVCYECINLGRHEGFASFILRLRLVVVIENRGVQY